MTCHVDKLVQSVQLGGQKCPVLNPTNKPPSPALTLRVNRATKMSTTRVELVSIVQPTANGQDCWLHTTNSKASASQEYGVSTVWTKKKDIYSYWHMFLRLVSHFIKQPTVGSTSNYSPFWYKFCTRHE